MSTVQSQQPAMTVVLEPYMVKLVHDYRELFQRWQAAEDSTESLALGEQVEKLIRRMGGCLDLALEKVEAQQNNATKAG